VRSEKGYGFFEASLKMGVGNGIFRSEIGSGFGDTGSTPPPKISMSPPPGYHKTNRKQTDGPYIEYINL